MLSLSLISVTRRLSYPVVTEQVTKSVAPSVHASRPTKKKSGKPRGRPKGSTNRHRREVDLSPSLSLIQNQIKKVLAHIGKAFKVVYFVFDGELGHHDALQMVRQVGLHLISKLRYNSALSFPYGGPYSGRGPRRKYGEKLDYRTIPSAYFTSTSIDEEIETRMYQMSLWHKKFADLLNIVVLVKTHAKSGTIAHIVLCSSDVSLDYEQVIDYYRLRFQIECNFRDAKQYWGLEDFMSTQERPVYTRLSKSTNLPCPLFGPLQLPLTPRK